MTAVCASRIRLAAARAAGAVSLTGHGPAQPARCPARRQVRGRSLLDRVIGTGTGDAFLAAWRPVPCFVFDGVDVIRGREGLLATVRRVYR
jgi:hypothetical protein